MTSFAARMYDFPVVNGTEVYTLPPPGYQVDFDNPLQIYHDAHIATFAVGGTIAFIAILQRFYTKIFLANGLQVDDLFMFLSWASSITLQSTLTWQVVVKALGVHIYELPLSKYRTYSKVTYANTAIFLFNSTFAKLSLAIFYFKLSPRMWFRSACSITIIVIFCSWMILTLVTLLRCRPVRLGYDVWLRARTEHVKCIDSARLYLTTAGMNILTDVALFALPIPMVLKLRLSKAQKAGAILIFAIGSITVCTSCIRCVYITRITNSPDPPWDGALADVWSFVESNLFIICGSTPTLRKFFKHIFPRLMPSASSRHSSNHSSSDPHSGHGRITVKPSTVDDIYLGDIIEVSSHEDHDPHGDDTVYEVVKVGGEGSSTPKTAVNARKTNSSSIASASGTEPANPAKCHRHEPH